MPLALRPATPADADLVAAYNAALALESEGKVLDPGTLAAGVRAVLADPAKGVYTLAESGGEVVGQLMLTYEWSDWRNGMLWWLQSVYVHQEYRARGVFTRIYQHILDESKRNGACGVRLYVEKENQRARRTYERLGMRRAHYEMYQLDFMLGR